MRIFALTFAPEVKFLLLTRDIYALIRAFILTGLQVNYDLLKPPGSRVVSASTRCGDSRVPHYHPLKRDEVYGVIISQYVADGGDGYHVFSQRGYDRKILGRCNI